MDPLLKDSLYKMAWATAGFMLVFMALAWLFHSQIEVAGNALVGAVGAWGIGIGIFMSDAFTLPIPPDVYLAAAITAGLDPTTTIIAGSIGSILGGMVAYGIGRVLGDTPFATRLVAPFRERGESFIDRLGVTAVVIAALTPIPFSIVCILAGMMRMQFARFAPATLFRIPRIAGYFFLIDLGWTAATV